MKKGYIAFVLDDNTKARILAAFPPKFPDVYAHHVTIIFGNNEPSETMIEAYNLIFNIGNIKVVGYVRNDKIEALMVSINDTNLRLDDKIYHLTLSLDKANGAKPVQSNELFITNQVYMMTNHIQLTGKIEFIPFN